MRLLRGALRLIGDRNAILILGFALGLALGPTVARRTEPLTLPALAVAITMTVSAISSRAVRPWRRLARMTLLAVGSSYGLGSAVILTLSWLLLRDQELLIGYVLLAAAPPGAAALALSAGLRGDLLLSLIGTVGAYLAALFIAPVMTLLLAGPGLFDPLQLLVVLLELVAVPLVVSRLLRTPRLLPYARRWREPVISWAFFLVILTVVGLNRDVFLLEPQLVGLIALVPLGSTFGLGALVSWALRRLRVRRPTRVSLILFATIKNSGLAAAVALALVSLRASLPGAVATALNVLYLIWLGVRARREAPG